MGFDEIDTYVSKKSKNKLRYPKNDLRKVAKGSIIVGMQRFIYQKDIEKKLKKL